MIIQDLKKGKKYWKLSKKLNERTRVKDLFWSPVYVMEVDLEKKQVLASINGTSPEWFNKAKYQKWKTERK